MRQLPADWRRKGLLIDANILVLWVVGTLDPGLIAKHKRTDTFLAEDYHLLDRFLHQFGRLATTPNVLTEVSNMAAQIGGEAEEKLRLILAALLEVLDERYVPSREACKEEEFRRLGLTDASLLLLAKQEFLVLTDDRHLYTALQKNGVDAVNFNHLRDGAWG